MKALARQLSSLDENALRDWIVRQLRGDNPGELRERYDETSYPIAAAYPYLPPLTREAVQRIVFELIRAVVTAVDAPPAMIGAVALVDPVFMSSALHADVLDLLLGAADRNVPGMLRCATLAALLRIGYRGTPAFWKKKLLSHDDEALIVILEGIAVSSVTAFFDFLEGKSFRWTEYAVDCIATLLPALIEQHGVERIQSRLMPILAQLPAETQSAVLAFFTDESFDLPKTVRQWQSLIEPYLTSGGTEPWTTMEVVSSSVYLEPLLSTDRENFNLALDNVASRWQPFADGDAYTLRLLGATARFPSVKRVGAVIGLLQDYWLLRDQGQAPAAKLAANAFEILARQRTIAQQLWTTNPALEQSYVQCLWKALEHADFHAQAFSELVRSVSLTQLAAPFVQLLASRRLTIEAITRVASMHHDPAAVSKLLRAIAAEAQKRRGLEWVLLAIYRYDPSAVQFAADEEGALAYFGIQQGAVNFQSTMGEITRNDPGARRGLA